MTENNLTDSQLMKGKRGLIMGVANDHSIAWGIADSLQKNGAELAFTYQGDAFKKRVEPLAAGVGSEIVENCDVSKEEDIDRVFPLLIKNGAVWILSFMLWPIQTRKNLKGAMLIHRSIISCIPCTYPVFRLHL